MDEETLRSIVESEIRSSVGYVGEELSEERRKAMDYYLGKPFGNEIEGRSQVVSTDVQDTIESMMPDFMEIFAGGDQAVRFDPHGPEDEPFADQATDYVNYIWHKDNAGFSITHDWIKDALLQKNGIIKIYWEEYDKKKKESFEGLNSLELNELANDDSVEITAHEAYEAPDNVVPFAPDRLLHDVTIVHTNRKGKICVDPVAPEEFLISRRAVSLEDAPFTCHKVQKTISDLIEMGYDRKMVEEIPSHDEQDYNEERTARFSDEEWPLPDDSMDPSMREVWLYECYIKTDYDDDGIAEMRQVTVAGPGYTILENMEVDDHPFESITPIKMPHKFFGRAVADLVSDVQLIKSTIQRQLLDNMYNINNARSAVNERVDLDDYLTNRPGGVIRVDGNQPVGDSIMPIQTVPLGPQAFNQLEYWDNVREGRTGITRLSQGLDADALNKTASGMNQLLGRTQRRMLLVARVFAETGFRGAFRKILHLIIAHQDRKRVIRLRNEWVPMDPREWNADMDVTVSVGLGYGTKDQQTMLMRMVLEVQKEIVGFQGGADGPLVTLSNIHNTLKKFMHSAGEKDASLFFSDPSGQPVPQRGPDPEMVKLQAENQLEMAKLRQDMQQFMEDLRYKYTELEMKYAAEDSRQDINAAKVAVDAAHNAAEAEVNRAELRMKDKENEAASESAAHQDAG